MQRKRPLFFEFLGKATLLWCNTLNLPKLEVGLVFRQVIFTPRTPSSFLNFGELSMKKTLIALAAVAATSAFAQSTVTLYGVVDAGFTKGATTTTFTGGGINGTSRLGFKGEEDLGGGLKAVFQVETGLNSGKETASSIGDRGAFVGLAGAFGTVTMGSSVLSPSFYARAATDTSTANNYGIAKFGGATRLDNSFNYTSPTWNGLTLRASMVQSDDNGGKAASDVSAVYANGPLTLAASSADNGKAEGKGSFVGAAYDLGVAKLHLSSVKATGTPAVASAAAVAAAPGNAGTAAVTAAAAVKGLTYTSVGVSAPIGAITLQADYRVAKDAADDTYVLSAQYALSKRTSLTAYTAKTEKVKASIGAGVRHNF
jgi:predicted porin